MAEINKSDISISSESKRRPGVLIVAPWPVVSQGGVNRVISHLIGEMSAAGVYRPVLLEKDWHQTEPHWDFSNQYPVCRLRFRQPVTGRRGFANIRTLFSFLATLPFTVIRLRKILKKYNITHINIHYPAPSSTIFFILKKLKLFKGELLLSLHNSDVRDGFNLQGPSHRLWKNMLREADSIIAVSQELKKDVLRKQPELNNNIHIAYNGVDFESFNPTNFLPKTKDHNSIILAVASFQKRKGLDVLLRSFQTIRSKIVDARLVIAGQSGEDYESFTKLAAELGITDYVDWKPDVAYQNIPDLLRSANLFVLPSRNEGFPLALLEAGAAGLPVVATRVGGVPELIVDGENGLLVPPEDPNALAEALSYLLENSNESEKLAYSLHQTVKKDFTWTSMYNQYAKILA